MSLNDFRAQELTWDKASKQMYQQLEANAGDSNGRKLRVQVINDATVVDLTGTKLNLAWRTRSGKQDGLDAFTVVDAKKGIFEIFYTTGMLSNVGKLKTSLVLIDSVGRAESDEFEIDVKRSLVDDETIQSGNSFTTLTEALVKINKYQTDIDGIKQNLVDESNQLITTEKAELDALQLDYAERADTLETTYAPRLTEVTAQLEQTVEDVNRATSELTVDSEVIFARGDELVLDDRLNKMDVEIATPDEDVVVSATNLIQNGDFSKGIEGWETFNLGTTLTAEYSELTALSITDMGATSLGKLLKVPAAQKVYVAGYFMPELSGVSINALFRVNESILGGNLVSDNVPLIYSSTGGKWEKGSNILTTTGYTGLLEFNFSSMNKGNSSRFKSLISINLTATFGAGNEPTTTQMDRLLTQFPNSWFDGTVNIYNSKHLMGMFFKELTKLNNAVIALGGNV